MWFSWIRRRTKPYHMKNEKRSARVMTHDMDSRSSTIIEFFFFIL